METLMIFRPKMKSTFHHTLITLAVVDNHDQDNNGTSISNIDAENRNNIDDVNISNIDANISNIHAENDFQTRDENISNIDHKNISNIETYLQTGDEVNFPPHSDHSGSG